MRKKLPPAQREDKTLFLFPYFGAEISTWRYVSVYIMRALLALFVSVGCALIVGSSFGIEADFGLALFTGAFSLFFSTLNVISRKSGLFVMIVAIILAVIFRTELLGILENAVLAMIDIAIHAPAGNEVTPFVYIVSAFFAFFSSFYVITSAPFPVFTAMLALVLLVPGFVGGTVSVSPLLVLTLAAVCACIQVSLCYSFETSVVGDTRYPAVKEKRPLIFSNRKIFREQAERHGRFSAEAFATLISVALIFSIVTSCVPKDAKLDKETIFNAITGFADSISGFFGMDGNDPFNGFFTADGSTEMNITNNIDANGGDSEKEVLTVTLSNPNEKVYRRGDLGYEFTGSGWKSISEIDYNSLSYDGYNMRELLDSYITDLDLLLCRQRLSALGYEVSEFIDGCSIEIDYLCDTNTLFTPANLLDTTFRSNENYNVYGDFVIDTRGKRKVQTHQTVALTPMLSRYDASYLSKAVQNYYNDVSDDSLLYPPFDMDYAEYEDMQSAYRSFIRDYYTSVPESESDNVELFIKETFSKELMPSMYSDAEEIVDYYRELNGDLYLDKAQAAEKGAINAENALLFVSFFKKNFNYSLTVDNDTDGNTKLTNFLFGTKSGHCALYATALTLIMRELGIPARYVTGFVVGGPGDMYRKTADGYAFPVYENNLHAWTEIYIDGIGWLPFDATPSSGDGDPIPSTTTSETASATTPPEPTTEPTTTTETITDSTSASEITTENSSSSSSAPISGEETDNSQSLRILLIVGIIILSLAIIAFVITSLVFLDKRLKANEKKLFSRLISDSDTVAATRKMLRITLKLLHFVSVRKKSGETPVLLAQRVDNLYPRESGASCSDAMEVFEKAEFSSAAEVEISESERRTAHEFMKFLSENVIYGGKNPITRFIRRYIMFRKIK